MSTCPRREQILKSAEQVLGNRELAEWWLTKPALGFDHRSPCSLLMNHLGYGHVRDFLVRLECGVYQRSVGADALFPATDFY
ncbi:antitoxin Xre/MbcA/ParS toxin-binding domain-containing protein [Pseudomonas vranovensis]|uniref:antitoxin Xre/MbcA/ParS toxin-binding domain-containing protein n=1 Tax=Pseudomonas vranovensis TaxID=321661 RepID=UPI003D967D70